MCGRFTNRYSWREIKELYDLTTPYLESNFAPRFNVAPMQRSFVVRLDKDGKRELIAPRWGLVPAWSKDDKSAAKCINARAETVADKPSYRSAFKSRPCLVIADGYYEWQEIGPKEKQPWYFTLKDNAPFAIAGLWESWPRAGADPLETFCLLTCEPNPLCAEVHDRMPVLLGREEWAGWLGTVDERKALLRPFPAERMQTWRVGKAVGNVRNEGPQLIEKVAA